MDIHSSPAELPMAFRYLYKLKYDIVQGGMEGKKKKKKHAITDAVRAIHFIGEGRLVSTPKVIAKVIQSMNMHDCVWYSIGRAFDGYSNGCS